MITARLPTIASSLLLSGSRNLFELGAMSPVGEEQHKSSIEMTRARGRCDSLVHPHARGNRDDATLRHIQPNDLGPLFLTS